MTDELGPPTSYMAVPEGVPVFSSDGEELGTLAHVLAEEDKDVFDGIVIEGAGHRFVDAPQVDRLFERGIVLSLSAEQARDLPEPSENPAVMGVDPDDTAESELTRKLRSAWDRISGRY
jgi:uncharacterized protein YrrD